MFKTADIIPLMGALGAEVSGIQLADLVKHNDSSKAEQLFQMLVENKVLVFRDQYPDPQTHVDVAKLIGDLAPTLPMYPKVAGHEDIIIILNDNDNPPGNEVWHADMTYREVPIFALVLHGVHVPPVGDNPFWVDMVGVAEGLSAPMRQFLLGLTARDKIQQGFSFVNENDQNDRVAELAKTINWGKATNHPFLRKHPVSGVETLFVNAAFTEAINELAADESDAMLRYLCSRIDNPRYQMRVKWRLGTVVMWDNWATQHYACGHNYLSFREVQLVTDSAPRYESLGLNLSMFLGVGS